MSPVDHVQSVAIGDVEVEVMGDGEPVVIIQTALTADELRPLAQHTALSGYQVIHYHRRGYAGSGPLLRPRSVDDEVAGCRALLEALATGPAHVVGVSYSAAIGLGLASVTPDAVRTLTVMDLLQSVCPVHRSSSPRPPSSRRRSAPGDRRWP